MDHLLRRGLRPPLKIQAYICKEVSNEYFPQFRGSHHALKRSIERQISISRFFSFFKCQDDSADMVLKVMAFMNF